MTIYTVTLTDNSTFRMSANLAEAAAAIRVNFHGGDDEWQSTPYQTADARHCAERAAELVNDYFRGGADDDSEVERVEVVEPPHVAKIEVYRLRIGGSTWEVTAVLSDGTAERCLIEWAGDDGGELKRAVVEHVRNYLDIAVADDVAFTW